MFNLLPAPKAVYMGFGRLDVTDGVARLADGAQPPGERLWHAVERLGFGGFDIEIQTAEEVGEWPRLEDSYAYQLQVMEDYVRIEADTAWGVLAALTVLRQLETEGRVPHCTVQDEARFRWRGLMLDVARHFVSVAGLRQTLDVMAYFRLNVLHLHLTDDQGFRFCGASFPELASEQHYSVEDLRALVAYAADRAIRIVPELDCPGHVTSWLLAHPEWGSGEIDGPSIDFGGHAACLDVSSPAVIEAVRRLFGDVAAVFPDQYVHFGGDEVNSSWWMASMAMQRHMAENDLADAQAVQAHFNRQVVELLQGLGKRPVGWDEVLHETLPRDVVVQSWRGVTARDAATRMGHQCIVSAPYYLDFFYPADVHYRYDPQAPPSELTKLDDEMQTDPRFEHVRQGIAWGQSFGRFPDLPFKRGGEVLGGEACLWSELVTEEILGRRVWSRMPAIAERFWSDPRTKNVEDMYVRLEHHLDKIERLFDVRVALDENVGKYHGLAPLLEMLEPVKWYARLLGMDLLQARANGMGERDFDRPYDTTTPLNRIVDRLPPESLATRRCLQDLAAYADMASWTEGWRAQHRAFADLCVAFPELEELRDASNALAAVADVIDGLAPQDSALAGPFGEYVLPIAHAQPHGA